jgi:hypothetical protein
MSEKYGETSEAYKKAEASVASTLAKDAENYSEWAT